MVQLVFGLTSDTFTVKISPKRFSPYRAVNTLRLGYKNQLMLYREVNAVCSQIHAKHINTLCGQNAELLNVKLLVRTIVTAGL